MGQRTVENGRLEIPKDWPNWTKPCGATRHGGRGICKNWAVVGMPTCKFHGSGGERNRQLGQLRYLAWIIVGGPHTAPVEAYCRVALSAAFDQLLKQGKGSVNQQIKAALWLTELLSN